jgi:excisionase family DNA binding protein
MQSKFGREAYQGLATTAEAQAFLRLSRTTLYFLAKRGELRPVKIGRAVRFRWADLLLMAGERGEK